MIINPYIFNGNCVPITNGSSLIVNGTTNINQYPAYGLYDYSWVSLIYQQALISVPRQIRGIEIEVSGYTTPYTYLNQTIKMAHIPGGINVFPASPQVDWSDLNPTNVTICKVFNWTISANGIIQILFDQNFCYNGIDNLILGWENRDGSWTSGYGSAKSIASTNRGAYKNQDGSYPTGTGTRFSYLMNIRLLY